MPWSLPRTCMRGGGGGLCDRAGPKKFEWHFSGLLTFSNTHGRLLVEFID